MGDDALVAQLRAAADAGDNDQARTALGILAFRRWDDVVRRVRMKVPKADVEDVAMQAMESAIKAAFAGESMGQFVSMLHTITDRRIADYHKRLEGKAKPEPLPQEHADAEDVWGKDAVSEDFTVRFDTQSVVDQALDEFSDQHRMVIENYALMGYSARETAERVNMSEGHGSETEMTEANVHQIGKRYRDCLRKLLGESEGTA